MILRCITLIASLLLTGCLQGGFMGRNPQIQPLLEPVDFQLAAYNAHDAERVAQAYAEQVRVMLFPQQLLFSGREELRRTYAGLFASSPEVHAELLSRQIKEPFVIDHERISGLLVDGKTVSKENLVIYRVESGTISDVWFLP